MRCHVFVTDSGTLRPRYCKYKAKFLLANSSYCHIHGAIYFNKYCIKIQSIWKGYKTRKKLKNLFLNLPRDIQRIIIYKISEDQYFNNYYNKIKKFINFKVYNFLFDIDYFIIIYYRTSSLYDYLTPEQIKFFAHILYLVDKYDVILDRKILGDFIYICKNFYKIYLLSDKTQEWNYILRYLKILNNY